MSTTIDAQQLEVLRRLPPCQRLAHACIMWERVPKPTHDDYLVWEALTGSPVMLVRTLHDLALVTLGSRPL